MSEYELNKEIKDKTADVITEINDLIELNKDEFQEDFFNSMLEIVSKHQLDIEEFIEMLEIYPTIKAKIGRVLIEQHYVDSIITKEYKENIYLLEELS